MSAASKNGALLIGAPPRADLLPPEIEQGVKARATRRLLVFLIIVSAAVAALGVVGATVLSAASMLTLNAATEEGNDLLRQQGEFAEVRQTTTMIAKAKEGLILGSSTEIDWKKFLAEVQSSLPAGTSVTSISVELATPISGYGQPSIPLQGARVGEFKFTGSSASLPDIEVWLNGLQGLTGYVDATPGSVILSPEGGYTVDITMHINAKVFNNRFLPEAADATTEEN